MIPNPKGFATPYVVESPPGGQLFEGMIYRPKGSAQKFITLSSGGWRLYKPGERVNNLHMSPWSPSSDVSVEFKSWEARAPLDAGKVLGDHKGAVPRFSLVPARDSSGRPFEHTGIPKEKVKVFGATDLQTIIESVQKSKPGQPIVLIPFACNYQPGKDNPSISCSLKTVSDIQRLF